MKPITGILRRISPRAAIVLITCLSLAGSAWALYPPDGAKQVSGAGPYFNPDDGICVVGLNAAGQLRVDWSIHNARDCVAYTSSLTGMSGVDVTATYPNSTACTNATGSLFWSTLGQKCYDTSACTIAGAKNSLCTAAGTPWLCCTGAGAGACMETNDGFKHAWSSSVCVNPATGQGISRAELDNDDSMCVSKGGTVAYAGKCVAYGWQYLNRKPDGTLPVTGSGISNSPGPTFADGLGFCSTTLRMTGGTYTATNCPSNYNSATYASLCTAAGVPYACCTGSGAGSTCVGFNNVCTGLGVPLDCCTGAGTGSCSWTTGPTCLSNTNGCQTQAQYDAGLGWSFSSSSGGCRYTYGVAGPLGGAIVRADGVVQAASSPIDLTTAAYDTMGECLAGGFTWDNWLPNTGTSIKTNASGGDYTRMPAGASIRRLDAISSIEDGGGAFYSGTGAVCLKCHSDMSRSYMERDKPGFVETRHKLAGDATGTPFQPHFDTAGPTPSPWALKGVQCAMCHSTAKPAQDDLLQVNPAGAANAGLPKSATGHNNTEYGTHLINLCYSCHGTAAVPATTNPASVIPSTTTDFTLTEKGLAPIANQFLNSPHAAYIGSSTKVDVGNKNFYTSPFEGWNCRSAAGNLNRSYSSQSACTGAGYTWFTTANYGGICYYTPSNSACTAAGAPAACCTGAGTGTCTASCGGSLNPTGAWTTSFTSSAYPWARDTGGPGGVCYGVGLGSIVTTVYRNGAAERIHNLDSTVNTACTNPGDGSATSGADGFWVRDGETSPGDPATTDQGTCMTCHDVHWALASTNPEAEPLRRECTTCHSNATASASNAPQVDVTRVNHLASAGTPLEHMLTAPDDACETCHMPKSSAGASRMHLFRINTSGSYQTMGAGQANVAADGAYAGAAWVDIDHACGQCHFANGAIYANTHPTPNWPLYTRGQLAVAARGMHPATGSTNPPPSATQTCASTAAEANNWTITVSDTSPNQSFISREAVNWGDGSVVADDRVSPFGPFAHTYIDAGTYPILHTVVDTIGQVAQSTCNATWSYFTIGGTVTDSRNTCVGGTLPGAACTVDADCPGSITPPLPLGTCTGPANTAPVAGASVRVTSNANGLVAGNGITAANGTYTVGSLKPGAYTVTFSRVGYVFTTPAAVTVGPSATLVNSVGTVSLSAIKAPKIKPKTPTTIPILSKDPSVR